MGGSRKRGGGRRRGCNGARFGITSRNCYHGGSLWPVAAEMRCAEVLRRWEKQMGVDAGDVRICGSVMDWRMNEGLRVRVEACAAAAFDQKPVGRKMESRLAEWCDEKI